MGRGYSDIERGLNIAMDVDGLKVTVHCIRVWYGK